jgi:hypothetical protein
MGHLYLVEKFLMPSRWKVVTDVLDAAVRKKN